MTIDPLSQDLSSFDLEAPATAALIAFQSGGSQLYGRIFIAQGTHPHPTVILLHGFPGTEQNFDLAHVFRRAGWNSVIFHYRGSWGSEGIYSFAHVLEDVEAAVIYLTNTETAVRFRINADQLVLIGHSLGGFAALVSAAGLSSVSAVASISGFNFGYHGKWLIESGQNLTTQAADWQDDTVTLNGATGETVVDEIVRYRDEWDLIAYASRLTTKPICLVGARRDGVSPLDRHYFPLETALIAAGNTRVTTAILDTDHGYNDKRIALARCLLDWLETLVI